jgi:hypothetical protein
MIRGVIDRISAHDNARQPAVMQHVRHAGSALFRYAGNVFLRSSGEFGNDQNIRSRFCVPFNGSVYSTDRCNLRRQRSGRTSATRRCCN